MKRTYQPKKRSRAKVHGFLGRMASKNGRKVIAAWRKKGRAKLAVKFIVKEKFVVPIPWI